MKMFKLCRFCFFVDLACYSIAMTLKNWPRLWLMARHRVQNGFCTSVCPKVFQQRNTIPKNSNRLLDIVSFDLFNCVEASLLSAGLECDQFPLRASWR